MHAVPISNCHSDLVTERTSTVPFPVLTFIDRSMFNNLQGRDFKLSDFPKAVQNYGTRPESISVMTHEFMRFLNNEMYRILFGSNLDPSETQLDPTDTTYIREMFVERLTGEGNVQGLLFEILPVTDTEYVVVLEKGFLNYLTSTKAAPEEFVLACLRCMHHFKCDTSQLIRLYLNLRLIDSYHKLIALRIR